MKHFFYLLISSYLFSSTIILVTKEASLDGSTIVAHTDDNELKDQRIIFVPAQNHKKNAKRFIYPDPSYFPRYVGKKKGPNYNIKGYPKSKALGAIPQIKHTYSYIDGNHAIINEKQLAIGECINSSKFIFKKNKNRIFQGTAELSKIALERCSSAKEAIQMIGRLLKKWGYFSWGETLIIADKEEGWVLEICSDPNGNAIWVAKKVPPGEIFVAANEFRIRDINPTDPNIIYSKNLFKIAEKHGWYDPKKNTFDWLRSTSPGEYCHPYYSLRRVWRLFSKINPDLKLSPWAKDGYTKKYPFSIKPKKKLSIYDIMNLFRDHYEGTQFDLTKGIAAGPFGNPNRYLGLCDLPSLSSTEKTTQGAWERALSEPFCKYCYVTQLRKNFPDPIGGITWIGLDAPNTTCFVPFYCGINNLPISYQTGSPKTFSKDIAWWAFNFVANWATLKYSFIIKDIKNIQKNIELLELKTQKKLERKALKLYKKNPSLTKNFLTKYCSDNANFVIQKWWQLSYFLIEKYTNRYINKPMVGKEEGYPKVWRDKTNYKKGPITYGNQNK